MLPELYRSHLAPRLTQTQLLTLEILVWLLQVHKNVKIERLAAHFPLPIKYESRRRHLQRFLALRSLSIPLLWFPIIQTIRGHVQRLQNWRILSRRFSSFGSTTPPV